MQPELLLENRAGLPEQNFVQLARQVAAQHSMKQALDWLLGQAPPLALTDMVTQDEFSHDFLVAYPGGLWLVYDSS
jgi:hypothetical protein